MDPTWTQLTDWATRPTPLTAGAAFLVFAAALWPAERLWRPRRRADPRTGVGTDLLFWAFVPAVGKVVTYAAVTAVVAALMRLTGRELDPLSAEGWGPVGRQPLWLQAAEALVLADLVFYWTHRLFHTTRLWPFHAVHHSSPHLDWLSAMRFHPVNDAVSRVFQAVPLVLLGFAPAAVVGMVPVIVAFVVVTHADVPWTWGPLRFVVVSPAYHHWHHSSEPEAIDKNFAGVLVAWDWLFGTLYFPRGRRPSAYGVSGGGVPQSFLGLLSYPFLAVARSSRVPTRTSSSPAGKPCPSPASQPVPPHPEQSHER